MNKLKMFKSRRFREFTETSGWGKWETADESVEDQVNAWVEETGVTLVNATPASRYITNEYDGGLRRMEINECAVVYSKDPVQAQPDLAPGGVAPEEDVTPVKVSRELALGGFDD